MNATPLENKVSQWQQQLDSIASLISTDIAVIIKSDHLVSPTNLIIHSKDLFDFPSDNVLYNLLNGTVTLDKDLNADYLIAPILVHSTNTELGYIFIKKGTRNNLIFTGMMDVLAGYFQCEFLALHAPQRLQKASYDSFIKYLHRNIMHAKRTQGSLSVFYLEIDKVISLTTEKEFTGKEKADCLDTLKVLIEQRLQNHFRAEDVVMYLYDNKFAAILVNFDSESHLLALANRQQEIFKEPFAYYGEQILCTSNIGCSFYPQDSEDASILFAYAEEAGESAHLNPTMPIAIYNERIGAQLKDDLSIQNYLLSNEFKDSLILKQQPVCSLKSNQLNSINLSLDIDVPGLGVIDSERFLNIATKNALLYALWIYLLKTAVSQAQTWVDKHLDFKIISLNVEKQQLFDENFVLDLSDILDSSAFPAHQLNIVISEALLLNNPEKVSLLIQQITAKGILVSLNNIKNYSSRAFIRELPVYQLEIYKDIVCEMMLDDKEEAFFDAIVAEAKYLGFEVIAPAVESEEQVQYLIGKGTHLGFGSYYKDKQLDVTNAE